MRMEYIEYLIDFSQTKSITATASRFYLSTQGMSRALRQLEKEIGVKLIATNGNSADITTAGQKLVDEMKGVMVSYKAARSSIQAYKDAETNVNEVVVELFSTASVTRCLIPLLNLHEANLFEFSVTIKEEELLGITQELTEDPQGSKIGLISLPPLAGFRSTFLGSLSERNLEYKALIDLELAVLVSASSSFAARKSLNVNDIRTMNFGYLNDPMCQSVFDTFIPKGQVRTATSNWVLLEKQICHNQIIVVAPRLNLVSMYLSNDIATIPLENSETSLLPQLGFVFSKNTPTSHQVTQLESYIESFLKRGVNSPDTSNAYRLLV